MKVRVHPADLWGCGHYRIIWPAETLRSQGYDVEIIRPGMDSGLAGLLVNEKLVQIELEDEADVYVFQRATNSILVDLIRLLRKNGKTVVVDMDDDLACIHPKNAAFHLLHPKLAPTNNWLHAQEACRIASLVTVSTPELLNRYGSLVTNRVLRNCIPEEFLSIERQDVEPTWGWAGALHSHPNDLPIIGGAVSQLTRQNYKFMIVGYPDGTGRALGLTEDPPSTGRVPFEQWATALSQLSIGVAPLADTKFNAGKSWLKPLEYAAVGVPWIGSDRAEYRELHKLGAGFVVGDRTRDWTRVLLQLLNDESMRVEAGEACRAVAAQATIEEHAWRWMETWETAYQLDHGLKPRTIVA